MRVSIGDIVQITFHDHAEAPDGESQVIVLEFCAVGVLVAKTRKEYVLRSWFYADDPTGPQDDNTHQWVVARKAIVKDGVTILKRAK
jgi:hypothetical protein